MRSVIMKLTEKSEVIIIKFTSNLGIFVNSFLQLEPVLILFLCCHIKISV
jgi:hypothetical protein